MPRAVKHLLGILAVLLVLGCSGGGCGGGCSSCGGITPLAEGFKAEARIENAGAVRLTDSGLKFLQDNLGTLAQTLVGGNGSGGVLTFDIPSASGSQFGIDYEACPGGPNPNANPPTCSAEIDVGNAALTMETKAAHDIHVFGTLPIRLRDLPLHITYFGFIESDINATLTGNGSCPGDNETFKDVPVDVDISIEIDSNQMHSRYGYSRVKIVSLTVDNGALQDALHFCGGFDASLLNGLKSILFDLLVGPLLDTLQTQIEDQLCQKANPDLSPTCPTGTQDNGDGVCRYGTTTDSECASIVLGTDGHMDLGGLLASLSPGTKGGLDFLFAAGGAGKRDDDPNYSWGDLNPIGGGATLGMYGGAEPMPVSGCVKFSDLALPTGIPIPDELLVNTVPDWPADVAGPHVGIALSERYANYALNGAYNSGLLCIGVSTETVALLNSGTLKLLIPSLTTLTLQREAQPVALVIRPGAPPTVTFGNGTDDVTDPVMRVKMPKASFDFYVWSLDRYIRFMSATFDLDVPVNLVVTPEGLQPVLSKIGVENGSITNSSLLSESPDDLIGALQGLIETQVGSALAGGINPIDISGALASTGLTLTIPESVDGKGSPGIRKLSKGTDNFLGIFATLGLAAQMKQLSAETSLTLGDKRIDAAGLRVGTLTKDNGPVVTIHLASPLDDGSQAVEYQWRVDNGPWGPFSRARIVDVRTWAMRLQGVHTISARARVVGQPYSLDPTPAVVEVAIDAEAPTVTVGAVGDDGKVQLGVRDLVSKADAVAARFRLDEGAWSSWRPAGEAIDVGAATTIEVEAKDAEGNVRSVEQALIRGKPSTASSGCGCSLPGGDGSTGSIGVLAALLSMLIGLRRRAATSHRPRPALRAVASALGLVLAFGSWAGCSCGDDTTPAGGGEQYKCDPPACRALQPGLIGAYTSTAVGGSTLWVAGYLEGDWDHDNAYGDLVVGKWDGEKVAWTIVDGVPTDPPADTKQYDKNGFRGGQTEPGPDVGLYTSIAVDGSGQPAVAYYDRTNRALKFAQLAGDKWQSHTVEAVTGSDVGRYAKLLFVDGSPVVAYLIVGPGDAGFATSKIRIARAGSGSPAEGDWAFDDAVVDTATPCRGYLCGSDVCVASTGACAAEATGCDPECGTGEACVDLGTGAACTAVYDDTKLDTYPDAVGDFVSLAVDAGGNLALAYYDRVHGNLEVASNAGGAWTRILVDGQDAQGVDTGDVGIAATLAIDGGGDWHVAYVDGYDESLKYVRIAGGTTVGAPEVVDTGLTLAGAQFDDGLHIVGDDAKIAVTDSGEVHVSYQDATAGKLRYAVGAPGGAGDTHTWEQRSYDQDGFAGAFSSQVELDGRLSLVNWWRKGGEKVEGDVALVTP